MIGIAVLALVVSLVGIGLGGLREAHYIAKLKAISEILLNHGNRVRVDLEEKIAAGVDANVIEGALGSAEQRLLERVNDALSFELKNLKAQLADYRKRLDALEAGGAPGDPKLPPTQVRKPPPPTFTPKETP